MKQWPLGRAEANPRHGLHIGNQEVSLLFLKLGMRHYDKTTNCADRDNTELGLPMIHVLRDFRILLGTGGTRQLGELSWLGIGVWLLVPDPTSTA
jgi:hypothetical protein